MTTRILPALLLIAIPSCNEDRHAPPGNWIEATTAGGHTIYWEGAYPPAEVMDTFDARCLWAETYLLKYERADAAALAAQGLTTRYYIFAGRDERIGPWHEGLQRYPSGSLESVNPPVIYVAWRIPESTATVPALNHEKGHLWAWYAWGHIEGTFFEHTWWPPLKAK
jgi:hypothetical protein